MMGFNNAIKSLRNLVADINEHAQILTTASNELKDASNNSGRAANEVAIVIGELSKTSATQADQFGQTADTINELGELVRTVSNDTVHMAAASQNIAASADLGQKVTGDVASGMNELYETT